MLTDMEDAVHTSVRNKVSITVAMPTLQYLKYLHLQFLSLVIATKPPNPASIQITMTP
jgi:hypothetical protein